MEIAGDGPKEPLKVVGLGSSAASPASAGSSLVVTTLHEAQQLPGTAGRLQRDRRRGQAAACRTTQLRGQLRQVKAPVAVDVRTGQQQADKNVDDIQARCSAS